MPEDATRVLPWRERPPRRTRDHLVRREPEEQEAPAAADDEIVPFTPVRARIAKHMIESKATSPHAAIVIEIDFDAVARVRAAHPGLTFLPFVARAVVEAIADFPRVNASAGDDELVVHRDLHLGIAVDLDFEGLVVPVIRDAAELDLAEMAAAITRAAERARARELTPDDVGGGTFTITNPGPYGTAISVPVINQPQVAILATDRVVPRAIVVEGDSGASIAVHRVGRLTLSFDHRAFDGAYAAAFLGRVRELLETRAWDAEP